MFKTSKLTLNDLKLIQLLTDLDSSSSNPFIVLVAIKSALDFISTDGFE